MVSIYPVLDERIKENKTSYRQLAQNIGLDDSALYRRLKGATEWKLPEIVAICRFFNEPDALKLFTIRY